MSKQSKIETGMVWPRAAPQIAQAIQGQMQELLDESQKAMAAWMNRRQEAIQFGLPTFESPCVCRDPAGLAATYTEWLTTSMNLITAEMNYAREEALRLAEIGQKCITAPFRNLQVTATATPSTGTSKAGSRTEVPHQRSAAG